MTELGGQGHRIVKNFKYTVASELVLAILKFLSRRFFVLFLGKGYLGLNGLFTDLLSVLSLAELGFGVSITYSLYRPAAQGDTEQIKSLMGLYRRVYRAVGGTVLALGVLLMPFLDFFVKEMPEDIPCIPLIYLLNVLGAAIPYFFSYKSTLLYVYQKKYLDAAIRTAVTALATAAQIVLLSVTGSYIQYLALSIVAALAQNAAVSWKTDRLYPYLKEREISPLPPDVLADLRRNVSAMMLHRMGTVAVFGTDNLLIAKFAGVVHAGMYSNYTMIRGLLNVVINALSHAVTPAMGNLSATAALEDRRRAFARLSFCGGWLFGWMSVCLYCLYDPFIGLWLGDGWLLPGPAVLLIVANFYVTSMRIPVANTKSVMGLFRDDRYKSIIEALLNLIISVLLGRRWGITGILAGTLASTMALPFWIEPLGLYRYGLKQAAGKYFRDYFLHLALTMAAGAMTVLLCRATGEGLPGFLQKGICCALTPNMVYLAAYWRREECRFLRARAAGIFASSGRGRK